MITGLRKNGKPIRWKTANVSEQPAEKTMISTVKTQHMKGTFDRAAARRRWCRRPSGRGRRTDAVVVGHRERVQSHHSFSMRTMLTAAVGLLDSPGCSPSATGTSLACSHAAEAPAAAPAAPRNTHTLHGVNMDAHNCTNTERASCKLASTGVGGLGSP